MLPLVAVAATSLTVIAMLNARLASQRTRARIEGQLRGVVKVLTESNFPLKSTVLRQMGGLATAELVLTNESGDVLESSGIDLMPSDLPQVASCASKVDEITLSGPLLVRGSPYYYSSLRLSRRSPQDEIHTLHVLFAQDAFNTEWRALFVPPLAVGAATLLVVAVVAHLVASRISRVLNSLRNGVNLLAQGGFESVATPATNDEIRELTQAVNQTATRLEEYEAEVRGTERLRTLSVLGAGLAHEIRNAATGCRMAIDLLSQSIPASTSSDECLGTARLQLKLIERCLTQFMKLAKAPIWRNRPQPISTLLSTRCSI